jgi:hypothetical protein
MQVLRERIISRDGTLRLKLPPEFRGKLLNVEVHLEDDIDARLLLDSIKIDTQSWTFSREEIYEQH